MNQVATIGAAIKEAIPSAIARFKSEEKTDYKCPACKDTGEIIRRDAEGRVITAPCKICNIQAKRRIKLLVDKAGLPYHNLDVPPQQETARYLQDFNVNKPLWLFFSGKAGSGKTTEAAWAAFQLICKNFVRTRFYSAFDLTRRLTATRNKPVDHDAIINELEDVDLVIVDDFFKNAPDPNSFRYADYMDACYEIIWTRYDTRKPLIITTQLTIPDFIMADTALSGRIMERSNGYTVTFGTGSKNWRIRT